tara:strand:+ start:232 stop:441 length:210 start_codon:yes stop_codon:yes gene_type:complete
VAEVLVDLHQILQQLVRLVELAAAVTVVIIQTEMEEQEPLILAEVAEVALEHPEVMMVMEPQEVLELLL